MEDLLYLVHRIPYPPNKGDKIRSYHLLRHLSKSYRVHLGAFIDDPDDWQHADSLRDLCGEIKLIALNSRTARLKSLAGLLHGQPLTLAYYASKELQAWVSRMLEDHPIHKAVVFSSAMAQFLENATSLRRIADFVDVDSDKWRQYAPSKPWPLSWLYGREARTLLAYEQKIAARFDATLFVSTAEAALFRQLAPESAGRIGSFDNGVDYDFFTPDNPYPNPYPKGKRVLVFTGAMDYWPNVDAVCWFAKEIFPAIHAKFPDTLFCIVGGRPAPAVAQLERMAGVAVTGRVADVRHYLAHAAMAVAPLRIARGIQNKVLEAMAMSRPVVVSPEAAEGIRAIHGEEMLVGHDAAEFQRLIIKLLTSGNSSPVPAARRRVIADYDWERNLGTVDKMLDARHD